MVQRGLLGTITGRNGAPCALESVSVEARQEVPSSWFERHAFGVVRRGVFVRQRIDPDGRRTAVDAAGPGALVPLRRAAECGDAVAGYAATRLVICVYRTPTIEPGLEAETLMDLLKLSQRTVERLESIAAARGRASATEKVQALIEALSEAFASPSGIPRRELPLAQRDLAELLHMRPETVCRALRSLERDGGASETTRETRPSVPLPHPRA